jgi:hypothetical protein
MDSTLLVATGSTVLRIVPGSGLVEGVEGLDGQLPTCLTADPSAPGLAFCGTVRGGVFRSSDGGLTWSPAGLSGKHVTSLATSIAEPGVLRAGTEPSEIWVARYGGTTWEPTSSLLNLPSSGRWAFPPRPETHHVRWIACHPKEPGVFWAAIEAGALISTTDGGATWEDRVPGGPRDTHELAIHPGLPDTLRAAAGDGWFESRDGGRSWSRPAEGLEVTYFRSVAIDPADPEVVVASAASRPRSAYVAGYSDGRLYRRQGSGAWLRIAAGWPDPPGTIAPLLTSGSEGNAIWAADERGVHVSSNAGQQWDLVAALPKGVGNLRGLISVR